MRKSRDTKGWLRLGIRGMAMGAADLVPGCQWRNGGPLSPVSPKNCSTPLPGWDGALFARCLPKDHPPHGTATTWVFWPPWSRAIGLSVALLAGTLHHLLAHPPPVLLWSFFFGLVAASVPFMLRDIPRAAFSATIVGGTDRRRSHRVVADRPAPIAAGRRAGLHLRARAPSPSVP